VEVVLSLNSSMTDAWSLPPDDADLAEFLFLGFEEMDLDVASFLDSIL
jgi:hypothetical protein